MPDWDVGCQKLANLLEADVLYLFEYCLAGSCAEALFRDTPREGKLCEDVCCREPCGGVALGLALGAPLGWLCTTGTRAAMANWGLPATFVVPILTIAKGAFFSIVFAFAVAVPASLAIVRRSIRR